MDQQIGFPGAEQRLEKIFNVGVQTSDPVDVALVLLQDFSMAAYACALEAFTSETARRPALDIRITTVGLAGYEVNSDLGIQVLADKTPHELRTDPHLIMVIGGQNLRTVENPWLVKKLRTAASSGAYLASVWSGTWSLSQAKLLDGYRCACHAPMQSALSWAFADVRTCSESFVMDRNRLTAFGPEGTTALVNKFLEQINRALPVKDKVQNFPTADYAYYETLLRSAFGAPKRLPKHLHSTLRLMCENLADPIDMYELAALANVSRRQLERRFMKYLGLTPNRGYLELRLTRAKQLIGNTEQPLKNISIETGFVSPPHFQRCFKELYGIPPSLYRKHLNEI
ncbi:helix-turn-helix domain-containing protein [Pseudomonas sp. CDFA 553]|uniref:GlxA family transcriptional regulator n=1 Tax=Pseudomonas quasicaspiana TaxID=2829821 RepID=UPI001E2AC159|nr:helix-turn-helix domain-containing protein [Pseudomonas quasicaspiana]MCD5987199.1 helix-turn-helix domain-containing protein [Pseudomonas quasicaspiana]